MATTPIWPQNFLTVSNKNWTTEKPKLFWWINNWGFVQAWPSPLNQIQKIANDTIGGRPGVRCLSMVCHDSTSGWDDRQSRSLGGLVGLLACFDQVRFRPEDALYLVTLAPVADVKPQATPISNLTPHAQVEHEAEIRFERGNFPFIK